jgi:hypothetical protein
MTCFNHCGMRRAALLDVRPHKGLQTHEKDGTSLAEIDETLARGLLGGRLVG